MSDGDTDDTERPDGCECEIERSDLPCLACRDAGFVTQNPRGAGGDTDYAERAREIKESVGADCEMAHYRLDGLLCEALRDCGEGELVDEFEDQKKWYA